MQDVCQCQRISFDDPRFLQLAHFIDAEKGNGGIAMSALQEAQLLFGYLPLEVHKFIAEKTGIPIAELYGVTTFYSQFTTEPRGRYLIQVCMGTACYVKGAQKVLNKVCELLETKVGATSADGVFTVHASRCLGCCGLAPVMMIGDDVYANLVNVEEIEQVLQRYREEDARETD